MASGLFIAVLAITPGNLYITAVTDAAPTSGYISPGVSSTPGMASHSKPVSGKQKIRLQEQTGPF